MSATADIARYKDYFKDLGRDERVEVLGIPNVGQKAIFRKGFLILKRLLLLFLTGIFKRFSGNLIYLF